MLVLSAGTALLASTLLWTAPLMAYDYSFSGESTTLLRMRTTVDKKSLLPLYDYLRLTMTDIRSDGSSVDFYLGAWGRTDLVDKVGDKTADGDLQYAYLTYRAPKNNSTVSVGRQFITEGVATERIDGLYLRNDFAYGIGASAYVGNTVLTQPLAASTSSPYQAGTVVYGGRISQENKKYYTVGLSALKSKYDGGDVFREETGIDLWVHPVEKIDLGGRSNYNNLTKGWMEHSYYLSYAPVSTVRLGTEYANVNLKDYLANVTTSALTYLNPVLKANKSQDVIGATAAYTGIKNVTLTADLKRYNYDQSGQAFSYGGKAVYSLPDDYSVGCTLHRMDGGADLLRYMEYRAFATKKIGHYDVTIDATDVTYDKQQIGITDSFAVTGAVGYEVNHKLKLAADVEYSQSPEFTNEYRGLVKATYTFDTKHVAEGGTKSEK